MEEWRTCARPPERASYDRAPHAWLPLPGEYTRGLVARPKLGQHFLRDQVTLRRIARVAMSPGDVVIEVGPGRGALTRHLLAGAKRVVAVELDSKLAARLPGRCGHPHNLEVVQGDILECDFPSMVRDVPTDQSIITGNLPYYITSPILRSVCKERGSIRAATFLMQEEVADRVVAGPGSKKYGFLSCLCRLHAMPAKLFTVPPEAFVPRPRVRSAIVRLELRKDAPPEGLEPFLSACFRHPRKMLRNNLAGRYPRDRLAADACSGLRAQQLGLDELTLMWRRLERA